MKMGKFETLFVLLQLSYLAVCDNLRILPEKKVQNKFVGNAFFVGCESTGKNVQRLMWTGPDGNQITNYLERDKPNENRRIHVEDGKSGHKGVDLVFENITRKDRGNYSCSANVDGREVQKSFELQVFRNIVFVDTPTIQYLEEGSDSTLKCTVEGDPPPRINWRGTDTKQIRPHDDSKFTKHPESPHWLVVKNATLSDAGVYKCVAVQLSPDISAMQTVDIEVKVRHKPLGTPEHVNESYSYVTGIVNLTCEVIAEPQANYTWLKDDVVIEPSENVQIFNENQKSFLQLRVEDEEMFGDYICKAQNRLGTLERVVTLQQGEKPPAPLASVLKTRVNEFHLNLTSKIHSEMPIKGYKVEYKRSGEEWRQANIREFKYGEPYILDGLLSGTLYVIRVSSRNIAGYSDYSEPLMKKTEKAPPIQQPMSSAPNLMTSQLLSYFTYVIVWCTLKPRAMSYFS